MRKSFKVIGILATLMSLVACQDLGAKLPKEDGEAKYGDIIDYRRSNSPISYTSKTKLVVNSKSNVIASDEEESNLTVEYFGGVNFDKLYYFVRAKKVQSYKDEKSNEKSEFFLESWKYYKDGYLYEVLNNQSKDIEGSAPRKTFTKLAMNKELALEILLEQEDISQVEFEDSMNEYVINKEGKDISSSLTGYWNVDISKGTNKSSLEYFSKGGEGNLSAVIKESGTFKTEAITKKEDAAAEVPNLSLLKYSSNYSFTFEKYHYGNFIINYSLQIKDLNGKEIGLVKNNLNEKVTKGCAVNYPKLDEYQEVTEIKGVIPF